MYSNQRKLDNTEVDVKVNDEILIECKLTEEDFTSKDKTIVNQYAKFQDVFHVNELQQSGKEFHNYKFPEYSKRHCKCPFAYGEQFYPIHEKPRPLVFYTTNRIESMK